MRERRLRLVLSLLLAFLFCATSLAQQAGSVESMKLFTPQVGWAATHYDVSWTTDSGHHWKSITPSPKYPVEIASVFFLDNSAGWVLLTRRKGTTNDVSGFDLARTSSGGLSWTILPIKIADLSPQAHLPGDGRMEFIDRLHGWINLGGVGSSAMNAGFILATADGGETWAAARGGSEFDQGGRGTVHFISTLDGWFTNAMELFVTHDGANTWRKLSLEPPPASGPAINPAYDLPVFSDDRRGFLSVTYSAPYSATGAKSALVLFATEDAGQTWRVDRILPNLPEISYGQVIPATMAESSWIVAPTSHEGKANLTALSRDGIARSLAQVSSGVSKISFASVTQGWAIDGTGRLLSTEDGGFTWSDITPGPARTNSYVPASNGTGETQPASQYAPPPLGSASVSMHVAFDEKVVAAPTTMKTWWSASPYFDVAFYLNGGHNRVNDPNLNASWIKNTSSLGYGLIPAWVDLQAPCACKYGAGTYPNCTNGTYSSTISTDVNAANQQGVASADAAAQSAGGLGIAGKIIYADIEQYDIPSTLAACGPAVISFLNGWISEVNAKGYLAGVYGSPADAANWNTNLSVLPQDIWVAKHDNRATIWGLNYGLTDSMWNTDQRIHQYQGTHDETWGGAKLQIDTEVEDAGVIGGVWKKAYSFSFTDSQIGSSYETATTGINNLGQQTGYYFTSSTSNPQGFVDTPGGPLTVDFPGAGYTLPAAVNDLGQVVGQFFSDQKSYHGFWYKGPGNYTQIDYPGVAYTWLTGINDNQQIVGYWQNYYNTAVGAFLYQNGHFADIKFVPYPPSPQAINGDGQIVGDVFDTRWHGFLCNRGQCETGQHTLIDYPGSPETHLLNCNNNGQIVGYYSGAQNIYYMFLYDENTVTFTPLPTINYYPYGLNDRTQIAGSTGQYGVVATPLP